MKGTSMKTIVAIALAAVASAAPFASAQNAVQVSTTVPVTHVYSPRGFDTNDNTQIIVSGYLPNLCYKSPHSEVKVDGLTIHVSITAWVDSRVPYCPMVVIPYLEIVDVGILDKGNYKIVVNQATSYETKSEIAVDESQSSAVDNHVYAAVDAIDRTPHSRKVTLKGYNPSPCFNFDHVEFISNGEDTFSVLPIMKQNSPFCPMKLMPFTIEAEAPATLSTSQLLLHVRSMNGQSVNALIDNR